jgi:hypothetical protein
MQVAFSPVLHKKYATTIRTGSPPGEQAQQAAARQRPQERGDSTTHVEQKARRLLVPDEMTVPDKHAACPTSIRCIV